MNAITIEAPRLPFHPAVEQRFGVDQGAWRVLTDAIFPAAERPESIIMALAYCKHRNLDIFKKPVQIVPIYDKKRGGMVDTVWPGIAELRTTAMRTGSFAGFEDTEYGPMVEEKLGGVDVRYPEWAQCTVYRLIAGQRVAFVGPKTFWIETYATAKRDTKAPNSMWAKRPRGQLEKCAEAAALRRAFPEEIGNEYAAEEVEGQAFSTVRDVTPRTTGMVARLEARSTAATGFDVAHIEREASALETIDPIPDFDATEPPPSAASEEPVTDPSSGSEAGEAAGPAEPNGDEETGPAAELLTWHRRLTEDLDGLTLAQITEVLTNPSDVEMFEALEAKQPQLALDLNKAIVRRKRELGQ